MDGLNKMCQTLDEYAVMEISKERNKVNTGELGEVVDMIKDLSEVKKNNAETCYYETLIDAMEGSRYGVDYDEYGRLGYSSNQRMMNRTSRRGYEPYMSDMENRRMSEMNYGRMGYSNNGGYGQQRRQGTRYGYSHDEFMEAKKTYSLNDPNGKSKRMEALNDYLEDFNDSAKDLIMGMSPEEKQMWKSKINNILNM